MSSDELYIEITNEQLYEMIPWFSQFIEVGRMGYRLDLTTEELATEIVNWEIKRHRKKSFKVFKGDNE